MVRLIRQRSHIEPKPAGAYLNSNFDSPHQAAPTQNHQPLPLARTFCQSHNQPERERAARSHREGKMPEINNKQVGQVGYGLMGA
jgi:hypothetical protein